MPIRHTWSRALPSNCSLDAVRFREEYIELRLYCADSMVLYTVNFISGKVDVRRIGEPELRGVTERKREFKTLICFKGYGNRAWTKIYRGLNTKMVCRKDVCVIANLKPNYALDINVVTGNGDVLESVTVGGVYHFEVVGSDNLIAVTTRGIRADSTITMLIDGSTGSVIDHITGFGGSAVSSLDYVFVYGEHEGKIITHGYNNDGEEIIPGGEEGLPVLPPFNPIPHKVPGSEIFEVKQVVLMGKNFLKLYNPEDYVIEYTLLKPPFTRGVFNINVNNYTAAVLAQIMGMPFIINYDFKGRVVWISHIIRDTIFAIISGDIVALYVDYGKMRETKIYSVKDKTLVLEESFGPNVLPLLVRRSNILLTDGRVVASYMME
ncbi:hypothetical protein Smar_0252 [Staphylothermus marinus F1]|uniref:Uncharacterized protein n=1 Tax=Staphylothermus marinus (strain ATCC 43588 / DSM 3639 / JCM 9404 / F1) TaxID=399550 RepID=A3DL55_STAMF|nr:hypothetical protein [Staphylothermus marinus]ABN69365.1 hypothetical protein Smar_0252 [Staphylothermus marinus F1]